MLEAIKNRAEHVEGERMTVVNLAARLFVRSWAFFRSLLFAVWTAAEFRLALQNASWGIVQEADHEISQVCWRKNLLQVK